MMNLGGAPTVMLEDVMLTASPSSNK